jgi:hypothetical protein
MADEFSVAQLAALSHPFDGLTTPDPSCIHLGAGGGSAILTCDIDAETMESFGGPVWHASICPPVLANAEALLAGVGEGALFDEPGLDVHHLRRRMTSDEIEQLAGSC